MNEDLRKRAQRLGLYGLLSDWDQVALQPWIEPMIQSEERERQHRSLKRRIQASKVGRFKPLADFDFQWPTQIDHEQISDLFELDWVQTATNVIFVGPNGVGKTTLAQNLTYEAIKKGATALFLTASEILNDLAAQEGNLSLQRRLRRYCNPQVLVVDELGYLSYDQRHADLLFEVVTRRYSNKPTLITTNKPFAEWNEVFPSATCVVTLVDRLVHHAEIVQIQGASYRLKEAKETAEKKAQQRARRRRRPPKQQKTGAAR